MLKKIIALIIITSIFAMLSSSILDATNTTLNKEIESYPHANKSNLINGLIYTNNDKYDNRYQYDQFLINDLIAFNDSSETLYTANVFEKKSNKTEVLDAISMAIILDAKCEIYVNSTDGSLDNNKLQKVGDSATLSKGYHTIKLEESIYLTGSKFAVVIKYTSTGNSKMYVPIEIKNNTETVNEGKSYITDDIYSNSWLDLGKTSNAVVCIKAYTLDAKILFDNKENIEVMKGTLKNINIPVSTVNIPDDSMLDVYITKGSQDVTGSFSEITGCVVLSSKTVINIVIPENIELGKYTINVVYKEKYNTSKELVIKQDGWSEIEDITPPIIELFQDNSNKSRIGVIVRDTQSNVVKLKAINGAPEIDFFLIGGIDIPIIPDKEIISGFVILEVGEYTVYAEDESGNSAIKSIEVSELSVIDTTPPKIELAQDVINRMKINVAVSDKESDIVLLKYSNGEQDMDYFEAGGTSLTVENAKTIVTSFAISEAGRYTVYAVDAAGNKAIKTISINSIDKDTSNIIERSKNAVEKIVANAGGKTIVYPIILVVAAIGVVIFKKLQNLKGI